MAEQHVALTFDDVRLRTQASPSQPLPEIIDLSSRFSRNVELKVPFVSAAMDTITTADMAIAMAKLGGVGVIHAGLSVEAQREEVIKVKFHLTGLMEEKPITVKDNDTIESVLAMCERRQFKFRTFPVINSEGRFVGMLSQKDFEFAEPTDTIGHAMTPANEVVTTGKIIDANEAHAIMASRKNKTLPVVDSEGRVGGLYLLSDVKRVLSGEASQYNVDKKGRLRVAIAVPTYPEALERVRACLKYIDVVVLDSADGDSYHAFDTLEQLKSEYPDLDVVVGNISEGSSAAALGEAGADGIKVGQGPGSICTTRVETGIGMPQVTAVYESARALEGELGIPVCADGGIRNHGDISIAIAAGAHSVMMGSMLAGTDKSPGRIIVQEGGARVKLYRGMGSASALRDNPSSRQRYEVDNDGEPLAEGVESYVPYKGEVAAIVKMCVKALRKSMKYVKAGSIEEHRQNTRFARITNAGLQESHPHDVKVISSGQII